MSEQSAPLVSIVDDDASLRRSLQNLLASAGLRAETFESAEAFLDSDSPNTTSCLVLDLRMPGMGGLDCLRRLAASGSRIPKIVLTAQGDEGTRERSLQAGAIAFLKKPVQGPAFVNVVRSALGGVRTEPRGPEVSHGNAQSFGADDRGPRGT